MSPGERCDEIMRLIDGVLDEAAPERAEAADDGDPVEEQPGTWGVYYLRPA